MVSKGEKQIGPERTVTLPRFYREVTDFINQYCRKEYGHSHSHDEGGRLAPQ
jgi:hypothetical protein